MRSIPGAHLWGALTLLASMALPAAAQTRATAGDLTGVVLDQTNAVVPGVTITVTSLETGLIRAVATDGTGRFSVLALPVGAYEIRAALAGFAVAVLDEVILRLGSSLEVSITLEIARTQEQITVVAARPSPVDVQKTMVGTDIGPQQIETLPVNRRDFMSFALLTPGATIDRTPIQGAVASSGLVFAGQRARSNNITVDGLDNNDVALGSVRATFSQEAVREFQVLTNSFSAEFGKASGGVLNIVTRSGTNTFAGNAFFYVRDRILDSKGYFDRFDPDGTPVAREKAPFSQLQMGGIFGGPIRKNRSFFFLSFERLDIRASNTVTIDDSTVVPDPRGGPALGTPADILRRAGYPIETGHLPFSVRGTQLLAKVDHQIAPNQYLVVRFNSADQMNENIEPWGGLIARSRGAALDALDYMLAASHTSVPSPRIVNEARFQYAYRDQTVNSLDPTCPLPCTREDQGGPEISVAGVAFAGRQRFTPQPRTAVRYQLLDTLSYSSGRSQLKGGVDLSVIETDVRLPLAFGGQYVFAALPAVPGLTPGPLSAIQAVALGVPVQYFQGFGNSDASFPYKDLSLFVQEEWRPRQRLTLKTGLRYQIQFWPAHTYHIAGLESYRLPLDVNNLAPRVSAAWMPAQDGRTVLRGSYGLFHDNTIAAIIANAKAVDGRARVRTFSANLISRVPITAWNSPGHRLSRPPEVFPSVTLSVDPDLKTPYAHHVSAGLDRELIDDIFVSASLVYARGMNHLGTIEYNPLIPELGPGRRPGDVDGRAGTSASVLQHTSYADSSYRGLLIATTKRAGRYHFLASYTLSATEDNATDYLSRPENNGQGRDPSDPTGLPRGFNSDHERGRALTDQRHRLVVSGGYVAPWDVQFSTVVTAGSGQPYDINAGIDFNGDGEINDRPRRNRGTAPSDYSSSIRRNAGTLPAEATVDVRIDKRIRLKRELSVDGIFEVFNLFNRVNFTRVNNTFGPGAYPHEPLPAFGQFTQAAPPRQVQLAVRVNF